jgi:hypothetical protein
MIVFSLSAELDHSGAPTVLHSFFAHANCVICCHIPCVTPWSAAEEEGPEGAAGAAAMMGGGAPQGPKQTGKFGFGLSINM